MVTFDNCLKNIEEGKIDRVYLFTGEEEFLQRECLDKLLKKLIPEETFQSLNFSIHSVATQPLSLILSTANQFPMMGSSRLVVVRNFEKSSETEIELLKNYLLSPNPSSVVVFQSTSLDKRRSISTLLFKNCVVVEFPRLSEPETIKWVQRFLQQNGFRADPLVIGQLVSLSGSNLQVLHNEIEKLIIYAGNDKTITSSQVQLLTVHSKHHNSFDLSDAVLSGDIKKALKLLHYLLEQGEEPVALIGMLAWLYRQMVTAYSLMENHVPRDEIAKEIRMHPGRIINFLTVVRSKTFKFISKGIQHIAEADISIKTSKATPRLILETLLWKLLSTSSI